MYRIDDPTASATLPTPEAALTEGYWTEGNPGTGVPATLERASWFNMVQEELRAVVVAGGLTPSKTTYTQVYQAIKILFGPGRWISRVIYSTAGTFTETPPANATLALYDVNGGGGGGGSGAGTAAGQISAGAGGGAGGRALKRVANPTVQTITVGASGLGATTGSATAGGTSSVGSIVSATGGAPGVNGTAGSGGTGVGGLGGTGVGGDIDIPGDNGFGPFGIGSIPIVKSGMGGDSIYGSGGRELVTYATGTAALGNASGGAGGCVPPSNSGGASGGSGTPGIVVIDYYS